MVSSRHRCCASPKQSQGGAALLVSLIMLLLMTVIGVATMNTTILESKMAGNIQLEVLAFNNAESSLRFAETDVQQNIVNTTGLFDFSAANDGYYDTPVDLNALVWDTNDSEAIGNDRYIVEYMGPRTLTGNSAAMDQTGGTSGSTIYVFQITARSQDNVSGSTQMLRSTYATLRGP